VIVRQHHGDQPGELLPPAGPLLAVLLFEHVDAELVGDVHVERSELARRVVQQRLGQRDAHAHLHARVLVDLLLDAGRHLGTEAKVEERKPVAIEVLPEGARFVVVFGEDARGRAGHVAPSRSGAEQPGLDSRARVDLDPFVRIDAHNPAMPRIRLIRVAVEVVT